MQGATLDGQRRVTLPNNFAPRSAITITPLDDRSVLIRMAEARESVRWVPVPLVDHLADDPEMDGFGAAAVRAPIDYPEPA